MTEAVLDRFCRSVQESGAEPILVFFPNRNDLQRRREDKPELSAGLVESLRRRGFATVDLLDTIHGETANLPLEEVFGAVHYTPFTTTVVARRIGEEIDRRRGARRE